MIESKSIVIVSVALTMGGVERSSVNLANALAQRGVRVVFITILRRDHFFELEPNIVLKEPEGFNKSHLSLMQTIRWLREQIVSANSDIIFSYTKFYSALVALALIGKKVRHFMSERSGPTYRWPWKIELICRVAFLMRHPYGIISQTAVASLTHKKYYGTRPKYKVIANPLKEVKLFPNISRENRIIAVGRLSDLSKRFDVLLRAFGELDTDWTLVFAGGTEHSNLPDLAKKLNLSNRVEFIGKTKDIDLVLARCSIYVITSKTEGFPNALCEAMAAGLACASFDFVAGPRELITHGTDGFIVPNGNVEELKNTLRLLMTNPEVRERIGRKAMDAREKFSQQKITSEYFSFFYGANG
jgi:glycosyltransferase involved in cell wall biosynthesis